MTAEIMEYQRVWAEINLDIIGENMLKIRRAVPAPAAVMAIVKADGYGHGAVEVAKVALYNGASSLGVAILDEGRQLRENNIHVPILILGYTPAPRLPEVIRHDLTQTVFHFEMAELLSQAAVKQGKTAVIHIKIDTGMSRLGFMPTYEAAQEIVKISQLPNIRLEGIYTHFAMGDTPSSGFSREQYGRFTHMVELLREMGVEIPVKHVSNSGAIVNFPSFAMDMVRVGIILYGLTPAMATNIDPLGLKPAMSLKTHVSYVKQVAEEVSVGYGRKFFTNRKTCIATVPVGYADGYLRRFGPGGKVLIHGQFAPIIGNICMDQFMVDVTDIARVEADDEIILIGEAGGKAVTADSLAMLDGTINYEVVCNIGKRVPRIYIKNDSMLKIVNPL